MNKRIITKKQIPVLQIKEILTQVKQNIPEWLLSPTILVTFLVNLFNDITIAFCYFILIGQTARLIVKQQKYANMKVLMNKWMIFVFFEYIFSYVDKNNLEGSVLKSVFLVFVLTIIYPSHTSKLIFKMYFKGQQTLKQSSPMTDSFALNNNSLLEKFMVILAVQLIKLATYITSFVNPLQRRPIDAEISEMKKIMSGGKQQQNYERSISKAQQNSTSLKSTYRPLLEEIAEEKSLVMESPMFPPFPTPQLKLAPQMIETHEQFKESIEKQLAKSMAQAASKDLVSQKQKQPSKRGQMANSIVTSRTLTQSQLNKNKKVKKYLVSQYLPLFSTANRSSVYPNSANKKCTYYREIQIAYDINSAIMTVTSLQDMKASSHALQEIVLVEDLMVQFEYEDREQIFVKFKNKNDFEEFISSIDMYESGLRSQKK